MIRYHHCAISFSPRKWQMLKHLSLLNGFPHHLQQDSIANVRVYFQIMVWMGMANEMNPSECGSKQENDQLIPIMTQNNAAPDELLKFIHCNYSAGCKSSRCSCRRYGLPCTAANCDNPNNSQQVNTEEEDDN